MVETRPTASSTVQPACLLIAPVGCDVPSDLLDGLRSRGVRVREVIDAPAVMAELATGPHRIVILVEPTAVRDADPLVAAIRHYHPHVSVWRYAMSLDPALQPWPNDDDPVPQAPDPLRRTDRTDPPASRSRPFPQSTGDNGQAPPRALDEDDDQPNSPLLTEEELAMLLGDDQDVESQP